MENAHQFVGSCGYHLNRMTEAEAAMIQSHEVYGHRRFELCIILRRNFGFRPFRKLWPTDRNAQGSWQGFFAPPSRPLYWARSWQRLVRSMLEES